MSIDLSSLRHIGGFALAESLPNGCQSRQKVRYQKQVSCRGHNLDLQSHITTQKTHFLKQKVQRSRDQ